MLIGNNHQLQVSLRLEEQSCLFHRINFDVHRDILIQCSLKQFPVLCCLHFWLQS
mgnify:CR=1 FL=1